MSAANKIMHLLQTEGKESYMRYSITAKTTSSVIGANIVRDIIDTIRLYEDISPTNISFFGDEEKVVVGFDASPEAEDEIVYVVGLLEMSDDEDDLGLECVVEKIIPETVIKIERGEG